MSPLQAGPVPPCLPAYLSRMRRSQVSFAGRPPARCCADSLSSSLSARRCVRLARWDWPGASPGSAGRPGWYLQERNGGGGLAQTPTPSGTLQEKAAQSRSREEQCKAVRGRGLAGKSNVKQLGVEA